MVQDYELHACKQEYKQEKQILTPRKALIALHGKSKIGEHVKLVDVRGMERNATIVFSKFENLEFDIAVVELCTGPQLHGHDYP